MRRPVFFHPIIPASVQALPTSSTYVRVPLMRIDARNRCVFPLIPPAGFSPHSLRMD
jgi:hypothetical protein